MKVVVHLTDDASITIENCADESVFNLIEQLRSEDVDWLTAEMDGDMVYINKARILYVDAGAST